MIGDYDHPKVRLPGRAAARPRSPRQAQEVFVLVRQTPRVFVETLDFRTSVGHGDGPGSRERLGFAGAGVTVVITDLGVLEPDPESCELTLTSLFPGVDSATAVAATGWALRVADEPTPSNRPPMPN